MSHLPTALIVILASFGLLTADAAETYTERESRDPFRLAGGWGKRYPYNVQSNGRPPAFDYRQPPVIFGKRSDAPPW